jgi:hypothetical protein
VSEVTAATSMLSKCDLVRWSFLPQNEMTATAASECASNDVRTGAVLSSMIVVYIQVEKSEENGALAFETKDCLSFVSIKFV